MKLTHAPYAFSFWFALASLTIGCSDGLDNPLTPTGSHSLAFNSDYTEVAVANTDAGTISFINEQSHVVEEIAVGAEPTRIARAGDKYFVTLRAERSVAVVSREGNSFVVEKKIRVGAEPYGVVATEHGTRVFVAASTAGVIAEISPRTLSVVRKWAIGSEVRWIALRPQNDTLYAVHAFGGKLSAINLNTNQVKRIEVPTDFFRTTRFTGDPAFSADGRFLILPGLLVDNHSTVTSSMSDESLADLPLDELADVPSDSSDEPFELGGGYNSERFQGGLFELELDPDSGEPTDEPEGTVFIPIDGSSDGGIVNSYPTSVSVSPSGGFYLATIEATHAVVAVFAQRDESGPSFFDVVTGSASHGDEAGFGLPFAFRSTQVVARTEGARGALFFGERHVAIDAFLGRGLRFQDISDLHLPSTDEFHDSFFSDSARFDGDEPQLLNLISATNHRLPESIERGRRLFFSGTSPQMSSSFSGVSCATCHAEGRNDGLSWNFSTGLPVRQTLTLAGKVSERGRVTWTGAVPTVAHEAVLTSKGRMGGQGLSPEEAQDIAAYIDWSREADYPLKNAPIRGQLAEGQALFFSPETGCASCHSGSQFGSDQTFGILGTVNTKAISLRGVAVTPPYMHDGSSPTLGDVLKRCRTGFMGDTSQLGSEELEALELYLRSL